MLWCACPRETTPDGHCHNAIVPAGYCGQTYGVIVAYQTIFRLWKYWSMQIFLQCGLAFKWLQVLILEHESCLVIMYSTGQRPTQDSPTMYWVKYSKMKTLLGGGGMSALVFSYSPLLTSSIIGSIILYSCIHLCTPNYTLYKRSAHYALLV